jgi:hypothetical protein
LLPNQELTVTPAGNPLHDTIPEPPLPELYLISVMVVFMHTVWSSVPAAEFKVTVHCPATLAANNDSVNIKIKACLLILIVFLEFFNGNNRSYSSKT